MFLVNFHQVFKFTHYKFYFQLKIKFKYKTVLNSITKLKKYFKAPLNVFFGKKIFGGAKKSFFFMIDVYVN